MYIRNILKFIILIFIAGLIGYIIGFGHGQISTYTKLQERIKYDDIFKNELNN